MRVLVTGGAGFIGRHLLRMLRAQAYEVVVVDAGYTGLIEELPSDVELVEADIATLDDAAWDHLLEGVDLVFHLAARKYNTPGVTAEELLDTNVGATWRLACAAGRAGVDRLVFTSSLYAYGSMGPDVMAEDDVPLPRTVYGASKLMGEHLLRTAGVTHGLKWNAARLFFAYGPGQHAEGGYKSVIVTNFEKLGDGRQPTVFGDGEQRLDYVFVDDVVDGLWALAMAAATGDVVNIASGVGRSINELTTAMQQVAGTDLAPSFLDADWTAGSTRVGDPRRCSDVFGWSASTDLVSGLALTWQGVAP